MTSRLNIPGVILISLALAACAPTPPRPDAGHVEIPKVVGGETPPPVTAVPPLPPPQLPEPTEVYSVVGIDVPLRELLFELARDAKINVDIQPDVQGRVSINAIDQTLPQILERLSRQARVRFRRQGDTLYVEPDTPYLASYKVDYVNMSRDNTGTVAIATQISTTGGSAVEDSSSSSSSTGNNNSTTRVQSTSNHRFWQTLERNIRQILGETQGSGGDSVSPSVIINAESGIVTVRATERQHRDIQEFLDRVLVNAQRQVLIEATIVEVSLNEQHQLGVDWSRLTTGAGLSFDQQLLGTNLADPPVAIMTYSDPDTSFGNIDITVKALAEFGDVKVLSSPKLMALNNQTALLKVVDNLVYFTIQADTTISTNAPSLTTYTTEVHTVPVGFVMSVTPQINGDDIVTLNVRPTISRVTGYVKDPNPTLADNDVESLVPLIQVRELDSILRVRSGQVAVLGGLIQDAADLNSQGLPMLSTLPGVGEAFALRNDKIRKTELVVFLRPRVVQLPSLQHELSDYQRYLPQNLPVTERKNLRSLMEKGT